MSGAPLLFLPGGNGHASASQRREYALRVAHEHLKAVVAILVSQMGGSAVVPAASLMRQYNVDVSVDQKTGDISYTARAIDEPAPEPTKEPT